MTVKEVAEREGITERSAQRYITVGYKSHKLPAARMGRAFVIAEVDYRAWRVDCGFDFLPQPADPVVPAIVSAIIRAVVPATAPSAPYPPYPQVANPGGPITNVPHETSGSMPHPLAVRDYMEAQARRMKKKLRGYSDEG